SFDATGEHVQLLSRARQLQSRDGQTGAARLLGHIDLTLQWLAPVHLADFSADTRRLAAVVPDLRTVGVWEVDGGRRIATLAGLSALPAQVALNRDGRRVAAVDLPPGAGDRPRSVLVWDVPGGQTLTRLSAHSGPDPKRHGAVA